MQNLVFDTAAVLNFGHRGELTHVLKKLSGHYGLLTTPGVVAELTDPQLKPFYQAFLAAHLKVQSASTVPFDIATLAHLSQTIDAGELSVLLLARELKAIAVLDDRAARREALRLTIQITGTVGLLQQAVTKGWMTEPECLASITKLCEAGFTIPRPVANQTLAQYLKTVQGPSRQKGGREL